jgi:hypothetical protein
VSERETRKLGKPIDRWLTLVGIVAPVIFWLFARTTPSRIAIVLACSFMLLLHPIWNFWYIEDYLPRRILAVSCWAIFLVWLGLVVPIDVALDYVLPSPPSMRPPEGILTPGQGPVLVSANAIPSPIIPVFPVPSAAAALPSPKPIAPKKKSAISVHPIITVSSSTVTISADTNGVDIVVTLMNTAPVEANAHIVSDIAWNGVPMSGSINERDIGFATSPFTYQLHFTTTLSIVSMMQLTAKTSKLAVILNVSYPDEGTLTTYAYEGDVVVGSKSLDDIGSGWTKSKP